MQLVIDLSKRIAGPTFDVLKQAVREVYDQEQKEVRTIIRQRRIPDIVVPPELVGSITRITEVDDVEWMVLEPDISLCIQSALGATKAAALDGAEDKFYLFDGKVEVVIRMALEDDVRADGEYYISTKPTWGHERNDDAWRISADVNGKILQVIQECVKRRGVVTEGALGKKVRAHEVRRITRELDDSTPHTVPSDVNRHIAEYAATSKIGTSRKRKTRRATKKRRGKTLKKRK